MMLHLNSAKCLLLDLSPLSPPKGHANFFFKYFKYTEFFLSKVEKELFSCTDN